MPRQWTVLPKMAATQTAAPSKSLAAAMPNTKESPRLGRPGTAASCWARSCAMSDRAMINPMKSPSQGLRS